MDVDVVMLTNTLDEQIYKMTCNAIRGMRIADTTATFNVILVETQPVMHNLDNDFLYGDVADRVIYLDGRPFNYNQALNIAFDNLSNAKYVVICNNDLVFRRGWFHELNLARIEYDLDVASPVSPGWPPHEEMCKQSLAWVFFGSRTSYEVAGWCFSIKREALDAIRPFDEQFRFEFQDVDMVEQLKAKGYGRMGLVRRSEVVHLLNQSHRLILDRQGMIEGADQIYRGKYGK